jgi:hypothetical protein
LRTTAVLRKTSVGGRLTGLSDLLDQLALEHDADLVAGPGRRRRLHNYLCTDYCA